MFRFVGCMLFGILIYASVFLYALLVDWSIFQQFSVREDLKELWDISVGVR